MARILSLALITLVTLVLAEDQQKAEEDPFTFDYHRLRVGGLIVAAVLCLIGITILFSGHCRCKFNQDKRRRTGSIVATQQMLNDTDSVIVGTITQSPHLLPLASINTKSQRMLNASTDSITAQCLSD